MIKYYACYGKIRLVEVERETDNSVWIRNCRHQRISIWGGYFDTWDAAKEFLLSNAQNKLDSARRQLEVAQSEYGNIKGLKE